MLLYEKPHALIYEHEDEWVQNTNFKSWLYWFGS